MSEIEKEIVDGSESSAVKRARDEDLSNVEEQVGKRSKKGKAPLSFEPEDKDEEVFAEEFDSDDDGKFI